MIMATFEKTILAGARKVMKNDKLRMKDIMEWSTGKITAQTGEVLFFVPDPGVYVCVPAAMDKR